MVAPSPMLHRTPTLSIYFAPIRLLHTQEEFHIVKALKISKFLNYFYLRFIATNEDGLLCIPHSCLESKARLKLSRSLKPMPPNSLGAPIAHQFNQWMPFHCSSEPHQNFAIIETRSLQRE